MAIGTTAAGTHMCTCEPPDRYSSTSIRITPSRKVYAPASTTAPPTPRAAFASSIMVPPWRPRVSLKVPSVRDVLGVQPHLYRVFVVLHGDQLGVPLRSQSMQRGHQVQFVLTCGKQCVNHFHRHFDFDLAFL